MQLAARVAGMARPVLVYVLHFAESAATELAGWLAGGVYACKQTHTDPRCIYTAACAEHRSID